MNIDTNRQWLPVYEALASSVRLRIIDLLALKPMNIKDLASDLDLSSAIITMHVKKLEKAELIRCERVSTGAAMQKLCFLAIDKIEIDFPTQHTATPKLHEFEVPIGHYTDFKVKPTCGLATVEHTIGHFDDPRYFLDPERIKAEIIWFSQGYLEYKVPNYLTHDQTPVELEIWMELSSEAPGINANWPSDITFYLNNVRLGLWTSPGDFGGRHGTYTPKWWSLSVNQYGLNKSIKINDYGTFIDGIKVSEVRLCDLDIRRRFWTFRIAVLEDSEHVGGLTLFGKGFGNYQEDIQFKLFYY